MRNTWPTKKLGELCEFTFGHSFRADDFNESGSGLPIIRIGDIDRKITDKFYDKKYDDRYLVNNGDILIGLSGTIKINKWRGNKALLNQRIVKVHNFKKDILEDFVFYQLPKILKILEVQIAQGTVKNVLLPHLTNLKVLVPPLSIQHRIVERLDAIQKAQELNDKQIALAEELFQSLLHHELDLKGKNWQIRKSEDLIQTQYGYTASAKEKGNYRFVRITDIDEDGNLKQVDKKYISADLKEIRDYILRKEDLLLARIGSIGKVLYFYDDEPAIFASYLIRLLPDATKIIPKYLWLFSRTSNYWRQVELFAGGAVQPQFNANRIKQIKIPLPPLEVQRQIVVKLQAAQDYKKKLLEQKQKLQELFSSCLDKAMKGELIK